MAKQNSVCIKIEPLMDLTGRPIVVGMCSPTQRLSELLQKLLGLGLGLRLGLGLGLGLGLALGFNMIAINRVPRRN